MTQYSMYVLLYLFCYAFCTASEWSAAARRPRGRRHAAGFVGVKRIADVRSGGASPSLERIPMAPPQRVTAMLAVPDGGDAAATLLYEEQEKVIVRRGVLEGGMIGEGSGSSPPGVPALEVPTADQLKKHLKKAARAAAAGGFAAGGFGGGGGGAGGFGGGGGGKKPKGKGKGKGGPKGKNGTDSKKGGGPFAARAAEGSAHASVLHSEGVVRVDGALSPATADAVRTVLYALRDEAHGEVARGDARPLDRFANVLLRENRCDLTVPLGADPAYSRALREILIDSPIGAALSSALGNGAALYELSCMISDPGSNRQVVHPDTPYVDGQDAALYTCFVALQDVRPVMGPTVWLPGTHTKEAHEAFKDGAERRSVDGDGGAFGETRPSPKDELLRSTPAVCGLLPKGSAVLYDSRLLHCGTANVADSDEASRALLYFSFKSPNVGYPGNPASIRAELGRAGVTLGELATDLEGFVDGDGEGGEDGMGLGSNNTPLIDRLAQSLR